MVVGRSAFAKNVLFELVKEYVTCRYHRFLVSLLIG